MGNAVGKGSADARNLVQADEYVIGVPMHNFGVPSVLKLWIDSQNLP